MDCRNGAILAMASAPGFDPNPFAGGENPDAAALLHDPAHPFFDRATRMAIPPGSVFKTVTAAALLEASAVRAEATFDCRGYLHSPDQWRCAIYRRQGIGHGEVTLADALAESCNVYFFHHAGRLRPEVLVDWASRFGFGQPTGVDLPGEAAGCVGQSGACPSTAEGGCATGRMGQSAAISSSPRPQPAWTAADTQLLAVGQGSLEATPLQVARMTAAVANGGNLVTPHVVRGLGLTQLGENQSDLAADRRCAAASNPRASSGDACRNPRGPASRGVRPERHRLWHRPLRVDRDRRQDRHRPDRRGRRPRLVRRLCPGRQPEGRGCRCPGARRRRCGGRWPGRQTPRAAHAAVGVFGGGGQGAGHVGDSGSRAVSARASRQRAAGREPRRRGLTRFRPRPSAIGIRAGEVGSSGGAACRASLIVPRPAAPSLSPDLRKRGCSSRPSRPRG